MRDGIMEMFELEAMESRTLLSAAPVFLAPPQEMHAPAVIQPLSLALGPLAKAKALAKIAGKYSGTVVVTGVHTRPVNVTLKESANGTLSGTLTSPQDSSIKVKISGKVSSTKKFSFTLSNGSHPGGAIAGNGSGSVKGTTLSIAMTFVQGSQQIPGKLTLKKV